MSLKKRGGVYHATFYDPEGKRQRRSTHQRNQKCAEAVERRWILAAADPAHAAAETETLTNVLERFFTFFEGEVRAGKRSAETLKCYRKKAGHLVRIYEVQPDGSYVPKLVAGWCVDVTRVFIAQRRSEGAGDGTIAKELVPLITGLKLAREAGRWTGDLKAVVPVGFTPTYKPRERWLPREEVELLMTALSPRRAAVAAFMVAVSAESSVAAAAQRASIEPDLSAVFVRGTKTGYRERWVPIESADQKRLMQFVVKHADGADGGLFTRWSNLRRELNAACDRAGIAHCSPNDLRRTFCSWMIQDGVPPLVVAKMMGHADTKMVLKVYAQLRPQDIAKQLRDALTHNG